MSPAFLGVAQQPPADGKQRINSLLYFICAFTAFVLPGELSLPQL